jgi:hypothetical protein
LVAYSNQLYCALLTGRMHIKAIIKYAHKMLVDKRRVA